MLLYFVYVYIYTLWIKYTAKNCIYEVNDFVLRVRVSNKKREIDICTLLEKKKCPKVSVGYKYVKPGMSCNR